MSSFLCVGNKKLQRANKINLPFHIMLSLLECLRGYSFKKSLVAFSRLSLVSVAQNLWAFAFYDFSPLFLINTLLIYWNVVFYFLYRKGCWIYKTWPAINNLKETKNYKRRRSDFIE